MARQCGFCDKWLRSKQAVRAHLRWCDTYLEAKEAGEVELWWGCGGGCGYATKQTSEPDRVCGCGAHDWEVIKPPPGQ